MITQTTKRQSRTYVYYGIAATWRQTHLKDVFHFANDWTPLTIPARVGNKYSQITFPGAGIYTEFLIVKSMMMMNLLMRRSVKHISTLPILLNIRRFLLRIHSCNYQQFIQKT